MLRKLGADILSDVERERVTAQATRLIEAGAPEDLAAEVAGLQPLTTAVDLVDLAEGSSWSLPNVARLYHQAGALFAFDRLRAATAGFTAGDNFERTAVRRLLEELLAEQAAVTQAIMRFTGSEEAGDDNKCAHDAASAWAALRRETVGGARKAVEEIEASGGGWSFAKLTIANAALRTLAVEGPKAKR